MRYYLGKRYDLSRKYMLGHSFLAYGFEMVNLRFGRMSSLQHVVGGAYARMANKGQMSGRIPDICPYLGNGYEDCTEMKRAAHKWTEMEHAGLDQTETGGLR